VTGEITGSTVPRRQLGRYMRDLRMKARLTVRAAAKELEWSEGKIWRIETGQTSMRSHDADVMCKTYGADTEMTEALKALAKETKSRGWWHSYGDVIPEYLDVYMGLEEAASDLAWYEAELVPGLIQTADYARTLIKADNPGVDDGEIERRVEVRIARQVLLTRVTQRPTLRVVLNEAVLRRPVGSAEILRGQLEYLAELSKLENVSLHIIPFERGLHAGIMSGPFVMLNFPTNGNGAASEPTTVYVEGFTGALYLDKPNEVERYTTAFDDIWSKSLDDAESQKLILTIARELRK
jgi:hypothetical protein